MTSGYHHEVLTNWERYAASAEEAFDEPLIINHLEEKSEVPGAFDRVFTNLRRDLSHNEWLVEEAGYAWVTERNAYRFVVEAFNQSRVLHALVGMIDVDDRAMRGAVCKVAARQALSWQLTAAEPYCRRVGSWRYVVIPYGWDNFTNLLLLAFLEHAVGEASIRRIAPSLEATGDWRAAAKGLLLLSISGLGDRSALIDSYSIESMKRSNDWFADALFSLAEFQNPVVRTLASLSMDWVIGHEVAHALKHETIPWSQAREIEADRLGLLQLLRWTRPRDLTELAPDLSGNFLDYLSARLGLMVLVLAMKLNPKASPLAVNFAQARSEGLQADMLYNISGVHLSQEERELIISLEDCIGRFSDDILALKGEIPRWATEVARNLAIKADQSVRNELNELKT